MSDISKKFTEAEWRIIQCAPLGAAYSIVNADIDVDRRELEALYDLFEKIPKNFPSNLLIQETFKWQETEDLNLVFYPLLEEATDKDGRYNDSTLNLRKNPVYAEIASIAEKSMAANPKLNQIIKNADNQRLEWKMSDVYLSIAIVAKMILEEKQIPETEEFLKAVYMLADELANAVKEGFLGFGKAVSKYEAVFLAKLKENILSL